MLIKEKNMKKEMRDMLKKVDLKELAAAQQRDALTSVASALLGQLGFQPGRHFPRRRHRLQRDLGEQERGVDRDQADPAQSQKLAMIKRGSSRPSSNTSAKSRRRSTSSS